MLTREQILECFRKVNNELPEHEWIEDYDEALLELNKQALLAIDLAAEVDRLKAERRWVPVSEPPNDDRPVLLTDGLDIYSGFYRNGNWHELNGYVLDGITHYKEQMPLPEPEGSEK